MQIALFYHSLLSDWNHGNAHFLRGIVSELLDRGHTVRVYEPQNGWSRMNLIHDYGPAALDGFHAAYPNLDSILYSRDSLDLDRELKNTDAVMVHEWNEPELVARIGQHRKHSGRYALLFHDTHHRAATAPDQMSQYDLSNFDGVLAFGEVLRRIYLDRGWAKRAWTWHEAADVRIFHPPAPGNHRRKKDLIWVGNWGDEERTTELRDFVVQPARELGLETEFYGVRYPEEARAELQQAGIAYRGWLANYRVPETFAYFRFTVHIPRRPYTQALPGIPTIRVFEALACGVPLISSPWQDCENLFKPGDEFLMARNGDEMRAYMRTLIKEPGLARELARKGLRRIHEQHTCAHRVDQLLQILKELGIGVSKVSLTPRPKPTDGHAWKQRDGRTTRLPLAGSRAPKAGRDRQ